MNDAKTLESAQSSYGEEAQHFPDEPDDCDCGISRDSNEVDPSFDSEVDQCECELWDEMKEREQCAEILRELSSDLDANQDPSRIWP
jgi:hypothetical protein